MSLLVVAWAVKEGEGKLKATLKGIFLGVVRFFFLTENSNIIALLPLCNQRDDMERKHRSMKVYSSWRVSTQGHHFTLENGKGVAYGGTILSNKS